LEGAFVEEALLLLPILRWRWEADDFPMMTVEVWGLREGSKKILNTILRGTNLQD
jgi:hypothetical protein